jgi:hypothetical protein
LASESRSAIASGASPGKAAFVGVRVGNFERQAESAQQFAAIRGGRGEDQSLWHESFVTTRCCVNFLKQHFVLTWKAKNNIISRLSRNSSRLKRISDAFLFAKEGRVLEGTLAISEP